MEKGDLVWVLRDPFPWDSKSYGVITEMPSPATTGLVRVYFLDNQTGLFHPSEVHLLQKERT